MWYSSEGARDRELQISFLLSVAPHTRIHETELIPYVADLPEMLRPYFGEPVNGTTLIDGSVSVVYNGEELLGPNYWFEFVTLGMLESLVCEKRPCLQRFGQRDHGILISEHENGLLLEIQESGRKTIRSRILPYEAFVLEWCLMTFRLTRIEAMLNGVSAIQMIEHPLQHLACDQYIRIVSEELLVYTTQADLATVLADPNPLNL
jgi:hypothetical protein